MIFLDFLACGKVGFSRPVDGGLVGIFSIYISFISNMFPRYSHRYHALTGNFLRQSRRSNTTKDILNTDKDNKVKVTILNKDISQAVSYQQLQLLILTLQPSGRLCPSFDPAPPVVL